MTTDTSTANTTEAAAEDEGGDDDLVALFRELYEKVEGRATTVASDAFKTKFSDPKAVRAELRDWLYPFFLKMIEAGGGQAVVVEEMQDRIDELQEDLDRLGNLTRAIASTNYFALVQHLVNLVLTRSQDPELQAAAQTIAVLFATPTPVTPGVPVAAPQAALVPDVVAPPVVG